MNKIFRKIVNFALIFAITLNSFAFASFEANAASNFLEGDSFEGDITTYWGFWTSDESSRTYDFYRSYDSPFGYGSYSAAIDASGNAEDAFRAILSSKSENNDFGVTSDKTYYLMFYAKATTDLEIITYLQNADSYGAMTDYHARTITNEWQRYMVSLDPKSSADALVAFVVGQMPNASTLYLDGIQVIEANSEVKTKKVTAYIGDTNKSVSVSNIGNFTIEEMSIELPFYDNYRNITTKKFQPSKITSSAVYFTFPEKTFSGLGKIYVKDIVIGQFDYNVTARLDEFHPTLIRLNEDLIVSGSGFSPVENSTFLITEKMNDENKKEYVWLSPESIDTNLSQMRFTLPVGSISGRMYIQSSVMGQDGVESLNKSNTQSYKLKPVLTATNWSAKGYEQVGDKLKIYGLGLGRNPTVKYYDEVGNEIDSQTAKFVGTTDVEIIEVPTTVESNNFNIAVMSDGVLSDRSDSLSYLAKPKVSGINSKYSRTLEASDTKIPAAKVGEIITINGLSLTQDSNVAVEFQGHERRIEVAVPNEDINTNGKSLEVTVPEGAVNGYLGVKVNGSISNYMPMEMVPTIISVSPEVVVPGETMTIRAYGVGANLNLTKVNFEIDSDNSITLSPDSINMTESYAEINLLAPFDLSFLGTEISVQYDRWADNGAEVLNIRPQIVRAGINLDNKVLSIIGYGFDISSKGNNITYKYANEEQTVVEPKVRILGVYPSKEGQEIRVQILDDYYFGRISVTVGEYTSNELNFGPITVAKIARSVEYIETSNADMGVLYISGYNFGSGGGVRVGDRWAEVHYRSDYFIIAVVPQENLYDGPVIVARE